MTRWPQLLVKVVFLTLIVAGFTAAAFAQDGTTVTVDPACVAVHVVVNGQDIVKIERHCPTPSNGGGGTDEGGAEIGALTADGRLDPIPDAFFWVYKRSYGYEVLWQEGTDRHSLQIETSGLTPGETPVLLSPEGLAVRVYLLPSGQYDFIGPEMVDGKHQEFIHPYPPGGLWRVVQNGVCVAEQHCEPAT